jgi:hypothetical protein
MMISVEIFCVRESGSFVEYRKYSLRLAKDLPPGYLHPSLSSSFIPASLDLL